MALQGSDNFTLLRFLVVDMITDSRFVRQLQYGAV
jgi:hypothetical protein